MILLIDNYDSFSYNLYQQIGAICPNITVIRNNEKTIEEIEELAPSHIVLSPGPGKPADAGICGDVVAHFKGKVPIFGVCLGHQVICEAFGATVSYAKQLMHGKQSEVHLDLTDPIFQGLSENVLVARYHSLAAVADTMPKELLVTARTEDQEIMAVRHRDYPVFGVQFHPESILTLHGKEMMENFLKL